MPETDALRLYVYLHFSNPAVTVEVEFPPEETALAEAYRQSIRQTKTLDPARDKDHVVAFELAPSATDVSTTRSSRAIIVHFKRSADAAAWADAVCRPVGDAPRQLYIKQYWSEADLAGLRETLETSSSSDRGIDTSLDGGMTTPDRGIDTTSDREVTTSDRRGPPPGRAMSSMVTPLPSRTPQPGKKFSLFDAIRF